MMPNFGSYINANSLPNAFKINNRTEPQEITDEERYRQYRSVPNDSPTVISVDRVSQLSSELTTLCRELKTENAEKVFKELIELLGERNGFWAARARELANQPKSNRGLFDAVDTFLTDSLYHVGVDAENTEEEGLEIDRLIPYNQMLTMYSRTKNADKFFELLQKMDSAGVSPDIYTYNALFKLRANRGELEELLQLATDMLEQNIRLDVVSYNILIEALGTRGWAPSPAIGPFGGHSGIASANRVLQMMSRLKIRRDPRTYEVMFNCLFKVDLCEELVALWDEMLLRGTTPTAESCSTVMKAMYRLGRSEEALSLWYRVKNILHDYIRHLEGKGDDIVRANALPRQRAKAVASGSWDPVLPNARTENVILDIFKEQGQGTLVFETWHLFRRADVTPLPSSCAALMEVYLDIGDYSSGLNVYKWLERVAIRPTARVFAVLIALMASQSAATNLHIPPPSIHTSPRSTSTASFDTIPEEDDAVDITASTAPKLLISPKTLDASTMSGIRQLWMGLRALDTTFHPPQLSTFEAVIASFHYAKDDIGVLDAFKILQETFKSRSPSALVAPSHHDINVISASSHLDGDAQRITRGLRHVPPLRGTISIENLTLVLDSHRRAQFSYGSLNQRLPEDVERMRILLRLEPTSAYERALGSDADELLGSDLLANSDYGPLSLDSGTHASQDTQSSDHWKLNVSEGSKLFSNLKNNPQPRFIPTAWNIAYPAPPPMDRDDLL